MRVICYLTEATAPDHDLDAKKTKERS